MNTDTNKEPDDGYGPMSRFKSGCLLVFWATLDLTAIFWAGDKTEWGKSFWDAMRDK